MTLLTLQHDGMELPWAKALAASLPASVRWVEQDGDVVLLSGQGDWPARLSARIETGQKQVIVMDPQAWAIGQEMIDLMESTDSRVMLCETHANNPAVMQFCAEAKGDYSAVTITGQGTAAIADLVLQQVRLARAAGFTPDAILHAVGDADRALATLQASYREERVMLRLTAVRSRTGSHHRLLTHGRVESSGLQVWTEPASRPATAFHISLDRTTEQPTIYESAYRASLRSMVASTAPLLGAEAWHTWNHDARLAKAIVSAL